MTTYAVLGLGLMGDAIVFDLLSNDKTSNVMGFEASENRRNYLKNKYYKYSERLEIREFTLDLETDVENHPLIKIFQENGVKVAYGAIDYKYNVYLTRICIQSKVNYFDLGGNPSIVEQQHQLDDMAKSAGVIIIPDLGLAPGLANIIAAQGMQKFDTLDECHIRVGGLPQPQYKKSILNYQQVFSIRGLTNEYLENAIVIREGKKQEVPSLTELEDIKFPAPYKWLEAFQTAGGTSSLPKLFEGKINELTYKTIRYHGHMEFFKFLSEFKLLSSEKIHTLGDITPRELIEYHLDKYLPKNDPDVVLMRVCITGIIDDQTKMLNYQLIDNYDEDTKFSAMARTTAFPISIIGQLVANGVITEKGVIPGEIIVPEKEFLYELEKRGINIQIELRDLE